MKLTAASVRGLPDRMILLPGGTAVFVELKRPDGHGRLSPAQRLWRDRLRFLGFESLVVSTPDEVDALMSRLDAVARGPSLTDPGAPCVPVVTVGSETKVRPHHKPCA